MCYQRAFYFTPSTHSQQVKPSKPLISARLTTPTQYRLPKPSYHPLHKTSFVTAPHLHTITAPHPHTVTALRPHTITAPYSDTITAPCPHDPTTVTGPHPHTVTPLPREWPVITIGPPCVLPSPIYTTLYSTNAPSAKCDKCTNTVSSPPLPLSLPPPLPPPTSDACHQTSLLEISQNGDSSGTVTESWSSEEQVSVCMLDS